MKKFNINDYKEKCVMNCNTEEKAKIFLSHLHDLGLRWHSGGSYLVKTNWKNNVEGTCYDFNEGTYCDGLYFKKNDYTILSFDDFDWEEEDLVVNFERKANIVIMNVLKQSDKIRGKEIIFEDAGGVSICSLVEPDITKKVLFVRGENRAKDNLYSAFVFDSEEEAKYYMQKYINCVYYYNQSLKKAKQKEEKELDDLIAMHLDFVGDTLNVTSEDYLGYLEIILKVARESGLRVGYNKSNICPQKD